MRTQTRSPMLFRIALAASGIALVLLMGYNMLVHSALADHEEIGPAIRESARLHAPITALYILGGDQLRKVPALRAVAAGPAREIADGIARAVRSYPPGAMEVLFATPQSSAQRHLHWTHDGAYLVLLVFAWLYWRRPRSLHLISRTHDESKTR
jgi:hypothetical protein